MPERLQNCTYQWMTLSITCRSLFVLLGFCLSLRGSCWWVFLFNVIYFQWRKPLSQNSRKLDRWVILHHFKNLHLGMHVSPQGTRRHSSRLIFRGINSDCDRGKPFPHSRYKNWLMGRGMGGQLEYLFYSIQKLAETSHPENVILCPVDLLAKWISQYFKLCVSRRLE